MNQRYLLFRASTSSFRSRARWRRDITETVVINKPVHLILLCKRPTFASPVAQHSRHQKSRHADIDDATLARHDVNVVKALAHDYVRKKQQVPHGAFSPVRNDMILGMAKNKTQRHVSQKTLQKPKLGKVRKKRCHSEPGRRPREEPAVRRPTLPVPDADLGFDLNREGHGFSRADE
jgi:hypothetical protein